MRNSIAEVTSVNVGNDRFILKLDVNEDPNKKGLKIQFVPEKFASLSPEEQNDIALRLEEKLNLGLRPYGMQVERDRQLKDKTVVGFFVYIEYFDKIVRDVLSGKESEE